MKKSKKIKFLVISLVVITFFMCFAGIVNANETVYDYVSDVYVESNNKYLFNYRQLMDIYAKNSTGHNIKYSYPYDVTEEMVADKTAVKLIGFGFDDGKIDSSDVSALLMAKFVFEIDDKSGPKQVISNLSDTLGYKIDDIELRLTAYNPKDNNKSITFSSKTSKKEELEALMEDSKKDFEKEILERWSDVTEEQAKIIVENSDYDTLSTEYFSRRLCKLEAVMPDGAVYTLVLAGENYEYNNWFMVRTKEAEEEEVEKEEPPVEEPVKEFKTELTYIAEVDGKEVEGTIKDGTFYPNYDRSKVEKDANVTAKITSTTKSDIVKIDGEALNEDGTPNKLGWAYLDKSDKTVIVKVYPFEKSDNLEDNGIVPKKEYELTSSDDLKSKETVSIEWPFRIIDEKQKPEKITEDTNEVRVIITTNLPIEEEKLPDGWKFTDDEEGKTQHRVYKDYKRKDGDKTEDVILTANDRDDTDSTKVTVKWPEKEKLPEVIPQAGTSYTILVAIIALAGFSLIIYRKLKK